jgi:hypothetical protein
MAQYPPVPVPEVDAEARLDLAPLSQWINAFLFTNLIPRFGCADEKVAQLCETLKIFQSRGLAETVACRECEEPHVATVMFDEGRIYYWCLLNGDIEVAKQDLELIAFDRNQLIDALSAAACLPARGRAFHAGGRLVQLGFVADQEREWFLSYADDLDNPNTLAGVVDSVAKMLPDGPGLIATPSRVPLVLPLPRSYKLIALHELFFGTVDRILLDLPVAWSRLGWRKVIPGTPGRPTQREAIRQMRVELIKRGEWPKSRRAQASVMLERWPQGDRTRPAPKTIENLRPQIEAEETEPGPF